MKKQTITIEHGNESIYANGYKGFINIMVCKDGKIRDGIAKTVDQINSISERISDTKNRDAFLVWAKKVIE